MPSNTGFTTALLQALLILLLSVGLAYGANIFAGGPALFAALPAGDGIRVLSVQEAKELKDAGAVFLDVRDALDYQDSHVPGAASLPLEFASEQGHALPLVVYCSDRECNKATVVAERIVKGGISVAIMPDGAGGWAAAGGLLEMSQ
ncbi:MAG: rhodanese-like domain-containing protein [Proteobacteria bacterium]|nr:rhodanese-like domain-containing protein [Pseudomonadota bacterium]MBU1611133.1 rhodanese-like domain-containing protein [Pseudomonadota bacterium]